jgi:hypothetical protein
LESAVENKNVIADFNGGHVAPDFFDAAERNNADCLFVYCGNRRTCGFLFARGLVFNMRAAAARWVVGTAEVPARTAALSAGSGAALGTLSAGRSAAGPACAA